ncbi:hypothetical protein PV735_11220 [Streptomyces turgidiscabies]|uniref:Uncharacterized protein n=1 Tax=Streptomyces turgidiscabies (strain Car8) TaxID=698760 RepID=L7EUV0_STRT8|nr:hypothetical protein [Streptomyces turgidiscabies]ELP62832.1 hypothetical protein STRTUCAR8_06422 [Streptomyces turgidiscabies Car8]MDX3493254.1 hypothetical protein [Streptomyces turgidiscabies]GAQ70554.1 hypothetical protein T45_02290 [Streptomyces turgidiscabies]
MTDRPYTDDDLRAEAVRQHHSLTEDPDFMGVGEQMQDQEIVPDGGVTWDDFSEGTFEAAQRSIHDLINGAANVSEWAVDIGADGLEPLDSVLSMQTSTGPLARIHFAVRPDMPERLRRALVEGLAVEIAKYLPTA